ncbi:hypothetical protein NW759_009339 [Fusarium solani]|jgi:hypothetical protein|uniref:Uncharacterized protein n=1 Tax=Fusarium solani TaxID=169388 RepID=A0A9P9K2K5_FUSSL|nr:uncharacterized protein B0J15DRAFT_468898 [Fusarium solani]KAH7246822.1 hypothetical protein B0J15DRAFT_468898 [Fusarium solani]KAJ4216768.1 hypothetical protein NW759_009339 [Fusarium solani]
MPVSRQSLQSRRIPQLLVVAEFLPSSALGGPSHQGKVCILQCPRERQSDASKAREKAKHVDEDSGNTELRKSNISGIPVTGAPDKHCWTAFRASAPALLSIHMHTHRKRIPESAARASSLSAVTLSFSTLSLDAAILANR